MIAGTLFVSFCIPFSLHWTNIKGWNYWHLICIGEMNGPVIQISLVFKPRQFGLFRWQPTVVKEGGYNCRTCVWMNVFQCPTVFAVWWHSQASPFIHSLFSSCYFCNLLAATNPTLVYEKSVSSLVGCQENKTKQQNSKSHWSGKSHLQIDITVYTAGSSIY